MTNSTSIVEMKNIYSNIYLPVVLGVILAILLAALLFFLWRLLIRVRRRRQLLKDMTPKSNHRMIGVRANDSIRFVVPTIQIYETTEDSLSETDSSGSKFSDREGRIRKVNFTGYQIHPQDLEKNLYEGDAEDGVKARENIGCVGFSLHYNYHRKQLCVRLIAATDIKSHFMKGTANPYVKLRLLPEKAPKYYTRVHRNTLNPVFNETFVFPVKLYEIEEKILKITLCDYDKYSRKVKIGDVKYPIKNSPITSSISEDVTTEDLWLSLKFNSDKINENCGELLISICYNREKTTLTLTILKARNIHIEGKEKDTASVYVKVTLYVRKKLVRAKKTVFKRKTPEIEFNNSFQIHVPPSALDEVDILITLCGKSGIGSKYIIGRTQVGANCISHQGIQHWQDMVASLNSTSIHWHTLMH
ncbi:synaptotagmin-2-like [Centruroides sculpturatus]|uniref:synaptotagmin-2-like n=1 Tax=Centruroides sculpturatus TaxID=218467 RepID=UPI000C6E138F|nr:synaptotagmin-2-like [Centruroides sculpturatus]